MKFGEIELGKTFGGYEIINQPANKLPQDLASAIGIVNSNPLWGATFNPLWLWGKQLATKNKDKSIVGLIINIPPGEGAIKGEGAKIVRVIESEKLSDDVELAFDEVVKELKGVSYKPVAYFGKQIVRGENHYILCEAKVIYPDAQPRAVILGINIFDGKASVVSITPVGNSADDKPTLFGYSFTW